MRYIPETRFPEMEKVENGLEVEGRTEMVEAGVNAGLKKVT